MVKPKLVFSDFDGTLTLDDELRPEFFDVLALLKSHNIPLVICTGRSKSWAHFLLTHFNDLKYVITEGGGVLTYVEERGGRRLLKDVLLIDDGEVIRLEQTVLGLHERFPHLELSVDSFGRQTDRAIELSYLEEHPEIDKQVREFFTQKKVNFSTSNVHMNFWCGEISKMNSIRHFLGQYGEKYGIVQEDEAFFFGDSLNDESVFKELENCIGVSNIKKVQDRFKYLPKTILKGEENKGILGVLNHLRSVLSESK